MPAPKLLSGLPKPLLFALYGAIGGLIGALVFAEPLWQLLEPPKNVPEPEVAVTASKDVEVMFGKTNTFAVQVDRGGFAGPVAVRFENVPDGVAIDPVTIPKDKTDHEVTIRSTASRAIPLVSVKVVAEGDTGKKDAKKPTAETTIGVQVSDPSRSAADVFFVLDVTSSMDWVIEGLRDGIGGFAKFMRENNIDFRVGVVAFRDLWNKEQSELLQFRDGKGGRDVFTADEVEFAREVGRLRAQGGGDPPESTLDAVIEACEQKFRPGATKVLLVITDNPPKNLHKPGARSAYDETASGEEIRETAEHVKKAGIDFVHLVIPENLKVYRPLQDAGTGKSRLFPLREAARGSGFNSVVSDLSRDVAEAAKAKNPEGKAKVAGEADKASVKSLQSSGTYQAGSEKRLLLLSGVWAGAVAALVCLVLLAGQTYYLRGSSPAAAVAVAGILGGLAAGLVGGASGYGLYLLSPGGNVLDALFKVFGWALLGGLAGIGLSFFIPNLKWVHGLAGGAIGGAVGAIGFLVVASMVSDFPARLVGGLVLGFCIGLMVAIVEAAFRRAWLEVRFGPRETIAVNLGPEPVKVGSDGRACTVWARGAPALALRYFIRNGEVICEDAPTRTEAVVGNGDSREVGNVTVTVRTGSSATPPAPLSVSRPASPPRPTASPVPPPPPRPKPLDDDDDRLPIPLSPTVAPRPPVPVAGTKPPVPVPPRPASAAPAPAIKPAAAPAAGPRDPDACPSCGRKNPGRPGSRFCMMCDQTY